MCLITLYLSPPSLLQLHHALRLDGLFRHKQGLVNSGDDDEGDNDDDEEEEEEDDLDHNHHNNRHWHQMLAIQNNGLLLGCKKNRNK